MHALSLFLFFTIPAFAADATKPLPAAEVKQYQACHHTADCVRVDNGCCDCANGGDTIAIHRKHEKTFRAFFKCDKTPCTQKAGDCTFQEPVCKNGFCELGPQKKWQDKK